MLKREGIFSVAFTLKTIFADVTDGKEERIQLILSLEDMHFTVWDINVLILG